MGKRREYKETRHVLFPKANGWTMEDINKVRDCLRDIFEDEELKVIRDIGDHYAAIWGEKSETERKESKRFFFSQQR